METLIAPFINVVMLLAVLGYYLKKPVADFIVGRASTLSSEIESARQALAEAQRRYEDYSSRLKGLDAEIGAIQREAQSDAERSRREIADAARSLSGLIVKDARAAVDAMSAEFRTQLQKDMGLAAVNKAEAMLRGRLTGEDHARIRKEFSTLVEKKA